MRLHLQARQRADARRRSSEGSSATEETKKQAEAGVDKALLQRLEGEQLKGQELFKNLAAAKVGTPSCKSCCLAYRWVKCASIERCQLLLGVRIDKAAKGQLPNTRRQMSCVPTQICLASASACTCTPLLASKRAHHGIVQLLSGLNRAQRTDNILRLPRYCVNFEWACCQTCACHRKQSCTPCTLCARSMDERGHFSLSRHPMSLFCRISFGICLPSVVRSEP